MQLTVAICTYAREELLDLSLQTLQRQTADPASYGILVVDNAGRYQTQQVAEKYKAHYVVEEKTGHSHARNRAMKSAKTEWVLFLDDDVQLPENLVDQFLERIGGGGFAALGGQVRHWFRTPPPRWLVRYYSEPMRPSDQTHFGRLPGEHYLIGCLFAIRKSAWTSIGGFSDAVGMHGLEVGRGDEDEFQFRLRQAGFEVYYDPEIVIDHLVQPYKHTMAGHLQLAYASGRDGVGMRGNAPLNNWGLVKRIAMITFYSVPFNLARWMFKPGYYWQNALADSLTKYYFAWGQYTSPRFKTTRS